MEELERLVAQVEGQIRQHLTLPEVFQGKVSVWIKLVRPGRQDGAQVEETVGNVHKVMLEVANLDELLREIADNLVLAVYGGDVQVVKEMPNLIVKLFARKAYVPMPGAPPLDQAGQVFLKATVYKWEPSLWDQLFNRDRG
jgi:hypothetical protein